MNFDYNSFSWRVQNVDNFVINIRCEEFHVNIDIARMPMKTAKCDECDVWREWDAEEWEAAWPRRMDES